jgi:ActR/RegA family two-component response regulator
LTANDQPKLLCVDDDANLLGAMKRQLSTAFDVHVAASGSAALAMLQPHGPFAVVVSDLRMPQMSGRHFLSAMRARAPDTTRIMLTGIADLDAAMAAVNDGQIFRFLCKPCTVDTLTSAVDAGVEQYRLRGAERELLEQTLRGSIDALSDVLALASPTAFGRARRIQGTAVALAQTLGIKDKWQVEVAALLSQLGAVTVPPDVLDRWARGELLAPEEERMVGQFPAIAESLLCRIPRLERVREIIRQYPHPFVSSQPSASCVESRILRLAVDLDALQVQGVSTSAALQLLAARSGYDPVLLAAARRCFVDEAGATGVRIVALNMLKLGMVLDQDLRDETQGMLLVARGYKVTESLLVRLQNLVTRPGLPEFVRVTGG